MKTIKNMLWMAGGATVGFLASKYYKDVSRLMKKGKKEISKFMNNM